jgi:hypothetical protein
MGALHLATVTATAVRAPPRVDSTLTVGGVPGTMLLLASRIDQAPVVSTVAVPILMPPSDDPSQMVTELPVSALAVPATRQTLLPVL